MKNMGTSIELIKAMQERFYTPSTFEFREKLENLLCWIEKNDKNTAFDLISAIIVAFEKKNDKDFTIYAISLKMVREQILK